MDRKRQNYHLKHLKIAPAAGQTIRTREKRAKDFLVVDLGAVHLICPLDKGVLVDPPYVHTQNP